MNIYFEIHIRGKIRILEAAPFKHSYVLKYPVYKLISFIKAVYVAIYKYIFIIQQWII